MHFVMFTRIAFVRSIPFSFVQPKLANDSYQGIALAMP